MKQYRADNLSGILEKYQDKIVIDIERGTVEGISSHFSPDGYKRIHFYYQEKTCSYYLHEVIAFVGGLDVVGNTVDHIDQNKLNNSISNLRAVTAGVNSSMGKKAKGSVNGNSSLTEDEVRGIKSLKGKMPNNAIAKKYGVSGSTVGRIFSGRTWSHIEEDK